MTISNSLPNNIGKPATNALNHIDIYSLEDIAKLDERTLSKIHGVGPKAVRLLKVALSEKGLTFNDPVDLPVASSFAMIGNLNCDNSPKRRMIRDFLVARFSKKKTLLKELLTDEVNWEIKKQEDLQGFSQVYKQISETKEKISSVEVHSCLSHGKEGSSHATITLTNGDKLYSADFYQFENHKKEAKIQTITTYIMKEIY